MLTPMDNIPLETLTFLLLERMTMEYETGIVSGCTASQLGLFYLNIPQSRSAGLDSNWILRAVYISLTSRRS